jgi:hexosaminidase
MNKIILLFFLAIKVQVFAQQILPVTPQPAFIKFTEGAFTLSNKTIITTNSKAENAKKYLENYLLNYHDIKLTNNAKQAGSNNSIALIVDPTEKNESKYKLEITENKIIIKGTPQGIFYGVQTLLQLLPLNKKNIRIPDLQIEDSARFSYRGMHFDVGRHFFSVDYVKKYIDFLALHKFNTFHWHLTEDQGWRIEIKKFPKLTETGSCRDQTLSGPYGSNNYDGKKYCGYYTQEQIKDIVKYAEERYVNIIPEIEMPGHSMAALSAYPYLGCTKGPYKVMQTWGVSDDVICAGNDSSFSFLEGVLDEVMEMFPSKLIHIGGDECPKERWHNCLLCQKRMKENNLKNEHELQGYFITRIEKYVNSKGRNIIGWDEILEGGLAPNASVMSWRGEEGGIAAAKSQHNAIMTPGTPVYFDHSQSINEDSLTQGGFNSLKMVYEYEPVPNSLLPTEAKYILGAQANMWTEYMDNERKVEYMLFPRMTALSEVLWCQPSVRNWEHFQTLLPYIFEKYDFLKINYSKAYYDIQPSIIRNQNFSGIKWQLHSNLPGGKIFSYANNINIAADYKEPVSINQSGLYNAIIKDSNGKSISSPLTQEFFINKATGRKIEIVNPPSNSYSVGGVLTLIDGVQNKKGMSKSSQFLGFSGTDLEVTLDLGELVSVDSVKVHVFEQNASWIYRPSEVSFYESKNGFDYELSYVSGEPEGKSNLIYKMSIPKKTRFLKIVAKNKGMIPEGLPGAGNKAWLFADEIEVF